jgi:hypothetical protein
LLLIGSIAAGISCLGSQTAHSQDQPKRVEVQERSDETGDEDRSWLTRLRGFHSELVKRRIEPEVGVIVPGSGLSFGANVLIPHVATLPIGAEVEGRISLRGYRELVLRLGQVANRRRTSTLNAVDAELGSLFSNAGPGTPGLAFYVEQRHRHLPSLTLYGQNTQGSLTRADFGRASVTTDAVMHWQATQRVGIGARVGTLGVELFPGTDIDLANIETAFAGTRVQERSPYFISAAGITIDRRDAPGAPSRGFRVDGLVRHFAARTASHASFTRATVDARAFRQLSDRHVVAFRVLGSVTGGAGQEGVPFYLMDSLGGGRTMRGFHSYRLRGNRLLTSSVESRWRVHKYLEVAPFVDAGIVGRPPLPGTSTKLLVTPGVGLRARTSKRVIFRADGAFGSEGARVAFAVDAPF